MNHCESSSKAGFSLVEVVVAIGVISFALVAIIGVLPIGLASGRQATQETRANHLAEQIFSTLRAQPFTNASLTLLGSSSAPIDLSTADTLSGATGVTLHASYDGQFVAGNDYFTIELRFRSTPDGIVTGTASEVRVQISSRESNSARMDYVSIIAAH
jgi:type II secretory pathway pseudopilin PulG